MYAELGFLKQVRDVCNEKRARETTRLEMETQLSNTLTYIVGELKENPLHDMQERISLEMEETLQAVRNEFPVETRFEWKCDTYELEVAISFLGEISQVPVVVPDYGVYQETTAFAGKKGSAPGELFSPFGVAVDQDTSRIFVANSLNDRVEIFSESGEYLSQLGVGHLADPYRIAIHGDSVYISSPSKCTVSKFNGMKLVRKIGEQNNGQFDWPRQLTVDFSGYVFVADTNNDRISVHDADLNHTRSITHKSMSQPADVKVSFDRVFILSSHDNPCIHVLTLEGELINSIITRGEGMDVLYPRFFCVDQRNNFVTSDYGNHSIRVFSPEGYLLHTIGTKGTQQSSMLYCPHGVALTRKGKLVCVSQNDKYGLQILQ